MKIRQFFPFATFLIAITGFVLMACPQAAFVIPGIKTALKEIKPEEKALMDSKNLGLLLMCLGCGQGIVVKRQNKRLENNSGSQPELSSETQATVLQCKETATPKGFWIFLPQEAFYLIALGLLFMIWPEVILYIDDVREAAQEMTRDEILTSATSFFGFIFFCFGIAVRKSIKHYSNQKTTSNQ